MFFGATLGMDSLSPFGSLGILILITGAAFSLMIGYIWYVSIQDMYSKEDRKNMREKLEKQKKKIARLYPQS